MSNNNYFSDKRVEEEAALIAKQHGEFTEAAVFWAVQGWAVAAVELLVILALVVTR